MLGPWLKVLGASPGSVYVRVFHLDEVQYPIKVNKIKGATMPLLLLLTTCDGISFAPFPDSLKP